jgi:ribosomal protein S18 acetylase RimI-like enzyme
MIVTYRNAALEDAATLDRLFRTIFSDTFAHLYRADDLEAFLSGFSVAGWEEQIANRSFAFRIAEADGDPVGYAKLGPVDLPIDAEPSALMLYQLYVKQACHGSGVGQALTDWTLEEARLRGAPALYLTVFVDNHRARRFYDRYGFEAVGPYKFMVGSQADEDIIMKKVL